MLRRLDGLWKGACCSPAASITGGSNLMGVRGRVPRLESDDGTLRCAACPAVLGRLATAPEPVKSEIVSGMTPLDRQRWIVLDAALYPIRAPKDWQRGGLPSALPPVAYQIPMFGRTQPVRSTLAPFLGYPPTRRAPPRERRLDKLFGTSRAFGHPCRIRWPSAAVIYCQNCGVMNKTATPNYLIAQRFGAKIPPE